MSLSTHVLDAVRGAPAVGVQVCLERLGPAGWEVVGGGRTDPDGRLRDWLPTGQPASGIHRLVFATGSWYAARRTATFYPEVAVVFEVTDPAQHLHVPLLLSPYAYSTYRGS